MNPDGALLFVCDQKAQSSASLKCKCLLGGVRPVASHVSDEPRKQALLGFFLENALGIHSSPPTWRRWLSLGTVLPSGTFSFRRSDRDTAPFFVR